MENIAWKLVGGMVLLLQCITLAFCGYIVQQLDANRQSITKLEMRVVAVETIQGDRYSNKNNNQSPN